MSEGVNSLYVLAQAPKRLFGQSDYDPIELNTIMRKYAEQIDQLAVSRGVRLTSREQQSSETGKVSYVVLTGEGVEFRLTYQEPSKDKRRASVILTPIVSTEGMEALAADVRAALGPKDKK